MSDNFNPDDPIPFDNPDLDTIESLLSVVRGQVAMIRERTNGFVASFNYTAENLAGKDDELRLRDKLVETRSILGDVLMGLHAANDAIRILPKYVGTITEPR
jgi:hypothetical protein